MIVYSIKEGKKNFIAPYSVSVQLLQREEGEEESGPRSFRPSFLYIHTAWV